MQHRETEDTRNECVELLVTPHEKALLMRAAALEHLDIASFVMRAVLPVAQEIVEREEHDRQKMQKFTDNDRKRTGEDLIAFFRNSPLAEIGIELERELERDKEPSRTIEF